MDIMRREVTNTDVRGVVTKLLPDSMASDITKAAASTYPLHEVNVHKVKVIKKPRFDVSKLLEMHGEGGKVVTKKDGETVVTDNYEPPVLEMSNQTGHTKWLNNGNAAKFFDCVIR